jgi:hypothetical protein
MSGKPELVAGDDNLAQSPILGPSACQQYPHRVAAVDEVTVEYDYFKGWFIDIEKTDVG